MTLRIRYGAAFGVVAVVFGLNAQAIGQTQQATASTMAAIATADLSAFPQWLVGMAKEAHDQGISDATIRSVLLTAQPIPKVLELDQRQPEFTQTFWTYSANALGGDRVSQGRTQLRNRAALLNRIKRDYGIPPEILLSFWGLETDYGKVLGDFPSVNALATLAFDGRRPALFKSELIATLKLIDSHRVKPAGLRGSWAGAFGNLQFMPSVALKYGLTNRGRGPIDLRGNPSDALLSAGNFLHGLHWRAGERWGRQVHLPTGMDVSSNGLSSALPMSEWKQRGVTHEDGSPLDATDERAAQATGAALLLPAGINGPAFLVYDNFRVIMNWNHSVLYGLAVGLLSDHLAGLPALHAQPPNDDHPLSRAEVMELQTRLTTLGLMSAPVDGLLGGQTQDAIKLFQRAHGRIPDGYADHALLSAIRTTP